MRRLLVVEDYPPLAKVIGLAAERLGYETVRTGSMQRALAVRGDFDAAIIDLNLPDGSGLDLARQLIEKGQASKVVFFTSTTNNAERATAMHVGPVIDKESGLEFLFSVVDNEIGRSEEAGVVNGTSVAPPPTSRSGTRPRLR